MPEMKLFVRFIERERKVAKRSSKDEKMFVFVLKGY